MIYHFPIGLWWLLAFAAPIESGGEMPMGFMGRMGIRTGDLYQLEEQERRKGIVSKQMTRLKVNAVPNTWICRIVLTVAVVLSLMTGPLLADDTFPAHRIAGNTYYVGSRALATYLITTPEGHILINSGFEETVPLIRASVESLQFKMSDVKILLNSHAHSDHVAGMAALKEVTGAKVFVMASDDKVVESGGSGQYLYKDSRWPACPVDRTLKDGDEVSLGGTKLIARLTPGHTRGCTTWTWKVTDADKTLDVVVIGSPNVNPGYRLVNNSDYPDIAKDFAKTFEVLKGLKCDLFLGAHGDYYGLPAKYDRLKAGEMNPFIDPDGYRAYVETKELAFQKTLKAQMAE